MINPQHEEPQISRSHGLVLAVMVVAGIVVVTMVVAGKVRCHRMEVKSYLQNANGLRAGAPVRMAGVDVGTVAKVQVRPQLRDGPAEIVMALSTPYHLSIPRDATVSLATAGVLGETFAEIDIRDATGEPIHNGDVLRGVKVASATPQQVLDKLANLAQKKPCDTPTSQEPSQKPNASRIRKSH